MRILASFKIWKAKLWVTFHLDTKVRWFKNAYELVELLNLLNKWHIFQCMDKMFCVEIHRAGIKKSVFLLKSISTKDHSA